MRRSFLILLSILWLCSCTENKPVESKWRVLDEQVYAPKIDSELLESSLDELEKIIYAPSSYFKTNGGMNSFSQTMKYVTESEVKDENRTLVLEETAKYISDENNSYKMSYLNNKNEGWDLIWKDDFLYRKQLGGEFSKTFSMGEHVYLREAVFGSIPSIYSILRDHADIQTSGIKKRGKIKGTEIIISFSNSKIERAPLEEKKYLQNLHGTEVMKDDALTLSLLGKTKKDISGTMTLFLNNENVIEEMSVSVKFNLEGEKVGFSIEGKRILSKKQSEKIQTPAYNEEYHRRTLDSSVNIMKDTKNDKE